MKYKYWTISLIVIAAASTTLAADADSKRKTDEPALDAGQIVSMQAKEFMIAFGRSPEGYEYDAIDGLPVNFFFIMAAPPYDDSLYLKVFKAISELVMFDNFGESLLLAKEPFDVIKAIRELE